MGEVTEVARALKPPSQPLSIEDNQFPGVEGWWLQLKMAY